MMTFGQSRKANKLYDQGDILYFAERYEEAILYYQKCGSLDKAQLAPTSENYYRAELAIAFCWSHIAAEKYNLGNYTEAIRLGTQAMEIYKKVFGEDDPDYAMSLNNLANYNSDLGNNTEAIRLGTQAMEIYKKVLGEDDPDYAT